MQPLPGYNQAKTVNDADGDDLFTETELNILVAFIYFVSALFTC